MRRCKLAVALGLLCCCVAAAHGSAGAAPTLQSGTAVAQTTDQALGHPAAQHRLRGWFSWLQISWPSTAQEQQPPEELVHLEAGELLPNSPQQQHGLAKAKADAPQPQAQQPARRGWLSWLTINGKPLGSGGSSSSRSSSSSSDASSNSASSSEPSSTSWRVPARARTARADPCRQPYPSIPPGWRSRRQELALTFDDGPDAEPMTAVLDVLKQHGIKATWFVNTYATGGWGGSFLAPRNVAVLQRLLADGHELGSHAATHVELQKLPPQEINAQIDWAIGNITAVTGGSSVPLFRAPYGSGFANSMRLLADERTRHLWDKTRQNHVHVHWTFNANDFLKVEGSTDCAEALFQAYGPPLVRGRYSGVVLMHATRNAMGGCPEGLSRAIQHWKDAGYTFVQVSDVVRDVYGASPEEVVQRANQCARQAAV